MKRPGSSGPRAASLTTHPALHRRCISEAQRTVSLWQDLAADLDGASLDIDV